MRKASFVSILARYKDRYMQIVAYACMAFAVLDGIVTRLVTVFSNGEFRGDQVRDAYVYMDMWHGVLPTLGPLSSVGGYALPPLYYYLVFPFTLLGPNPVWQALPNAIFSFASIPLLMLVVYMMLKKSHQSQRLLLSGIAGLWWSLSFSDMSLAIKEWNPSPIPCFLLLFILLANAVLEKRSKQWHAALLWVAYGLVIAVLVSLHSSAWLIMPFVALIHCIATIVKTRQWYWPLLALLVATLALWPYWSGEIARGWTNTQLLFETLQAPSEQPHTLLDYLEHSVESYAQLGKVAYFPGQAAPYIASMFVYMVLAFFLAFFQGNKRLIWLCVPLWALYMYSTAHYWGPLFIHYQLLVLFTPIIFAVGTLGYLHMNRNRHRVVGGLIVIGMVFSMGANAAAQKQFLGDSFGKDRIMNTNDIQHALQAIPNDSTVCGEKEALSVYTYLDTTMVHRNMQFSTECLPGMYMIFPHYSNFHDERDYLRSLFPAEPSELEQNTIFSIYYFTKP